VIGIADLRVRRTPLGIVELHVGDRVVVLDAEETRWLQRKLGEALLAPVEPTEPMPARPPMRDDQVLLVRRMHRASWARDLEPA
jgi:hypothetical protein